MTEDHNDSNKFDDRSAVIAVKVPSEQEAELIVETLRENGIRAVAVGGLTSNFRAEAPGLVQVMVEQANLQQARQIIESITENTEKIDWSQIDVGEPTDDTTLS